MEIKRKTFERIRNIRRILTQTTEIVAFIGGGIVLGVGEWIWGVIFIALGFLLAKLAGKDIKQEALEEKGIV